MKRLLCLLLSVVMVLGLLSGCGAETAVPQETQMETQEIQEIQETTAPVVKEESPEVQLLLEQEWVPEAIRQNLDETILWNEMLDMLANIITLCDASALESWNAIVRSNEDKMQRDDGMLAIYEAACVLGIGHEARKGWVEANTHFNAHPEFSAEYSPNSTVFANIRGMAPYEDNPGHLANWDYWTSARLYSLGHSSAVDPEPFFDYVDEDTRYSHPLTRREAITATAMLIQAYEYAYSGGYTIPQTNWNDPLLSDAKAAREAILNSPTTITRGEELILGETYTGTAYYVSNSGNDGNNGKSPETAWATLNKVEKANLKYGDVVFFERGGIWYGTLKMKYGVTYSAYGEGAKPIITGSPQDAAQEEKWTLYAETSDGGKVWQYAEEMPDAGVILLDGGAVVARKAYPLWNGKEYTNSDGEIYVVEEELADLMFFSAINLTGKWAAVGTRLSLDKPTIFGPLYLRCDAGNPGQIFAKIEIAILPAGTSTANKGWIAVDNLHFSCYSGSGMDCNNHSNIVYQNCEAEWCGGAVQNYQKSWNNPNEIMVQVSGGGMLLFGTDLTCRNNYIHDCESKGIAIAVNASGESAWLTRCNLLAEGNVLERCGTNVVMWIDNGAKDHLQKLEDIRFTGNFFVNAGYGWRQRNMRDLQSMFTQAVAFEGVKATGEILFENNLFYCAAGSLMTWYDDDLQNGDVLPTLRGNTYVQDKNQILFTKRDERRVYPETTLAGSDQALMEQCVREYMGDATGQVIILE